MEAESIRADVLDLEVTITRCVRSPTETRAMTAGLTDEWETCGQILVAQSETGHSRALGFGTWPIALQAWFIPTLADVLRSLCLGRVRCGR